MVIVFSLFSVVLLTLSRQGLIMMLVGLVFFSLTTFEKKEKWTLILLVVVAIISIGLFYESIEKIYSGYYYRFQTESQRIGYWEVALEDMKDTIIYGQGGQGGYSSVGIKPHSAFLYLHYAFGSLAAFSYVLWIFYLVFSVKRLICSNVVDLTSKIEGFLYMSIFFMAQFTTVFAPSNYGFILALAIFERKTNVIQGAKNYGR
ncbi:hypothetical protein DESUT3_28680 [Desulfuromonas versatilis]|uniref:O-antigen ligase-related domain-containing protein n=1 Tax=Desulfuromonas versatilis TaxID=2802975 RepID=A0ABN6E1X8_9BACT|nr:hypothetical protein DESUT3_28680 [Desulfuromonas versatilis]